MTPRRSAKDVADFVDTHAAILASAVDPDHIHDLLIEVAGVVTEYADTTLAPAHEAIAKFLRINATIYKLRRQDILDEMLLGDPRGDPPCTEDDGPNPRPRTEKPRPKYGGPFTPTHRTDTTESHDTPSSPRD